MHELSLGRGKTLDDILPNKENHEGYTIRPLFREGGTTVRAILPADLHREKTNPQSQEEHKPLV